MTRMIRDCDARVLGSTPGLPDEVFDHDGLITKRQVRATALAQLRPLPGETLWDLGAGAASIAIEWCRAAEGARAIGVEQRHDRAERARSNAERLTVPGALRIVEASVDDALGAELADQPAPDAVFIGGGATQDVLTRVWQRLPGHGRVLVHGITLEAEVLAAWAYQRWGGQLSRIQTEHAAPLGSLTGWTPARVVTAWLGARRDASRPD